MSDNGYPRFLQEMIDCCPEAGAGVHPWIFRVARYMHRYYPPEEICAILEARTANCGRHIDPHEIIDAVKNSGACAWSPENSKSASERRAEWLKNPAHSRRVPKFNPERAIEFASQVPVDITPGWLKSHSRIPVFCPPGEYLRSIHKPEGQSLVFSVYKSQGHLWPGEVEIERWSRIHRTEGAWFLCNPVDGLTHFNPRLCKDSRRSEESVTSFTYGVLECDHEPKEIWFPIWLKILVQLKLEIVSITDSAGKSAHALVRGACESKKAWDEWKRDALLPLVELGACEGSLSAVRLTRLPGAYRGDKRQELLYLNPAADGTPIFREACEGNL
jgi:hypothetical protein